MGAEAEKLWRSYGSARRAKIVDTHYRSALYLKERIESDGWEWSWNYLREHARCCLHLDFSNTVSSLVYAELRKAHPDISHFKDGQQGSLFESPPTTGNDESHQCPSS